MKKNISYKIKNANISVSLKITNAEKELADLCSHFFNQVMEYTDKTNESKTEPSSLRHFKEEVNIPSTNEKSDMIIRERLPNDNIYDLSKMKVNKAETKQFLVRCPNCKQSHAIILKQDETSYVMVRDFKKQEFMLVSSYDNSDVPDEENDLMHLKIETPEQFREAFRQFQETLEEAEENIHVITQDSDKIFCPICKHSDCVSNWKDCYEKPNSYSTYGYDYYCDCCGGEANINCGKDGVKLICECCGYDQSYALKKE